MKHVVISIVMSFLLCLFLCSCGSEQGNQDDQLEVNDTCASSESIADEETIQEDTVQDETEKVESDWSDLTDEDITMLHRFKDLEHWLENYATEEYPEALVFKWDGENYRGSAALGKIYQILSELEPIDSLPKDQVKAYLEQRYGNGSADRQGLMEHFTWLENVPLSQTLTITKRDGSVSSESQVSWKYTEDGEVCWENPLYLVRFTHNDLSDYDIQREYDADGRVTKTLYSNDGKVKYTIVYSYDENGHLTGECRTSGTDGSDPKDYQMACDAQGRVISVKWHDFWDCTILYSYNDKGQLVKEESIKSYNGEYHSAIEYTYDENGILTSGVYTSSSTGFSNEDDTEATYSLEYTCDDQGRVTFSVLTYNDSIYTSGDKAGSVAYEPTYSSATLETIYGNYYFYK